MDDHSDWWLERRFPSWFPPFTKRLSRPPFMCVAVLLKVCTGVLWAAHPQLHPAYMSFGVGGSLETLFRGGKNSQQQEQQLEH